MTPQALLIRRGDVDRDLNGILTLDAVTFTNPWTREMYEFEARRSDVSRLYVAYPRNAHEALAEAGSREPEAGVPLVAYCAVWVIYDELHINNLAVHPDWRRQGVARLLLDFVLQEATEAGACEATLEVRRSNLPALKLYEGLGFAVEGVRPGYYSHPEEDALVLWRRPRGPEAEARNGSAGGTDPTS
jgi:ribosomal-protein-alanine N-acetyltransferase